jgi:hypothetical protein
LPVSTLVVVPPTVGPASTLIDFRDQRNGTYLGQVTLTPGHAVAAAASGWTAQELAAGPPGYFFAYKRETSGFEFYTLDGRANSLMSQTFHSLIFGYRRDLAYDSDGVVYALSGEVIDARVPSAPRRLALSHSLQSMYLPLSDTDLVLSVVDRTVPGHARRMSYSCSIRPAACPRTGPSTTCPMRPRPRCFFPF